MACPHSTGTEAFIHVHAIQGMNACSCNLLSCAQRICSHVSFGPFAPSLPLASSFVGFEESLRQKLCISRGLKPTIDWHHQSVHHPFWQLKPQLAHTAWACRILLKLLCVRVYLKFINLHAPHGLAIYFLRKKIRELDVTHMQNWTCFPQRKND